MDAAVEPALAQDDRVSIARAAAGDGPGFDVLP